MPTTLTLIRHGEVENPLDLYYGRLPGFGLNEKGRQQAEAAAQLLKDAHHAAIFSSPLLRARQTAGIIIEHLPNQPPLRMQISSLLIEVHSPYDGQPRALLNSIHWDVYSGADEKYEQPGDVLTRMHKFAEMVRRRYPGQHVLAVSHGDPIEFYTLWVKGLPVRNNSKAIHYPAPASLSTFIFSDIPDQKPVFEYLEPQLG